MTKNGEILFDPGIPGEFISPKAKIKDQRKKIKDKRKKSISELLCGSVAKQKREIPSSLRSSE
jgi:hypothetical protein